MKSVSESIFAVDIQCAEDVSVVYGVQDARELGIKEAWFRDAIFACPDLVVAPCRAAGLIDDDDWHPWAKEFSVFDAEGNPVGKIDVLLVSSSGHIGIVETKLSYSPQRRREVLAQVFDYATHISEMNIGDLPELPKDGEGRVVAEREDVHARLTERQLLLIVAGDNLDPRAEKLGRQLLGAHLVDTWDLAFVDLPLYKRTGDTMGRQYLVVPSLRGVVQAEVRQVVQIKVDAVSSKATIQVQNEPPEPPEPPAWTKELFFKSLESSQLPTEFRALATEIASLSEHHHDVTLHWGRGRTGTMTLKRNDNNLIEYYLDGRIRFRPPYYFEAALGKELAASYLEALKTLFPKTMQKTYPNILQAEVLPVRRDLVAIIEKHLSEADRDS